MAPSRKRKVVICDGRMRVRNLVPFSPFEGPPLPRILACSLAGTAMAGIILLSPADVVRQPPPQMAYQVAEAARETIAFKTELPVPPLPPPPPALPSDNATSAGAVRGSFTVIGGD